ncbi:VOC family protein [Microlunatus parietis]|uniref:Putative glyoxalase superfamily protein PhnB n=1 Tax=Microlunatus parietis TaxID=682979 RepID=A0A7Y9ICF8_9ACTN|nr:VOC family protein [Microlunatus parietis]NYE74255.1 putative glyoxalase superfamily protein PhnB [Microlunatus parietis]
MESTTPPGLWPSLGYRDATAAVQFLKEALGFEEIAIHPGSAPGAINQAVLRWRSGAIITVHTAEPEVVAFQDLGPRIPIGIYLHTDDPDGLYERAVRSGAKPFGGPETSHHATRDATVADPEGCLWSFGTYRGD